MENFDYQSILVDSRTIVHCKNLEKYSFSHHNLFQRHAKQSDHVFLPQKTKIYCQRLCRDELIVEVDSASTQTFNFSMFVFPERANINVIISFVMIS